MLSREKTKTDDQRQDVNDYPVKEQYVLSRLLSEYVSLYRIELNSGKYEILRLDANTNAWQLAETDPHPLENFDEYTRRYADNFILDEEKEEFIDCLYDLFHKEEKEDYDSFLDMLYGKFGKSIVEKFLKPYNEKLYAVDLKTLDKDAMGRFFPYADIPAIIDNMKANKDSTSYNNSFLYPRNGAGSFIQILYDALDSSKILMEHEVVKIDNEHKVAQLDDGSKINYEYLINTSPLNHFLGYFEGEKFSALKNRLSYNKVLVFNLGFNKKSKFTEEHWMYIPDKAVNFYRIGFYDNILDADKLSMYIEIGYGKEDEITEQDVEMQLKLTLENLHKLGIIDDDTKLEEHSTIIMDPAYVHINTETEKMVQQFKAEEEKNGIYTIGRYGAWTYCSMEDCMIAARDLAMSLCQG